MNKEIIAQRLKTLRESARLSQAKMAQELGIMQPLIAKYETAVNIPSYPILLKYADYFDVSCDYLLGRAENPQGKLYSYNPKSLTNNPQMKEFVEMCFDPNSSVNAKLNDALYGNMKFAYRNREFWCKEYYVDTVGKNTKAIKEYIATQLEKDKQSDQLSIFDPRDPFTGGK